MRSAIESTAAKPLLWFCSGQDSPECIPYTDLKFIYPMPHVISFVAIGTFVQGKKLKISSFLNDLKLPTIANWVSFEVSKLHKAPCTQSNETSRLWSTAFHWIMQHGATRASATELSSGQLKRPVVLRRRMATWVRVITRHSNSLLSIHPNLQVVRDNDLRSPGQH